MKNTSNTLILSIIFLFLGIPLTSAQILKPRAITNGLHRSNAALKRHADIVFAVDLEFEENNGCATHDAETANGIEWLAGSFDVNTGIPTDDHKGMLRILDEKLREKGVIPRYGLVVYRTDTANFPFLAYQSFRDTADPNPEDLWSSDIGRVEEELIEQYRSRDDDPLQQPRNNADGHLGQDAIMRILGLQVNPGDEDDFDPMGPPVYRTNFPVEPAYEFNPGSRSIVLISDHDTTVDTALGNRFDIEDPNGVVTPDVLDHKRRSCFHGWILDELEDEDITVHTITQDLFAANAFDKEFATPAEQENRSRLSKNPETNPGDGWFGDEEFLRPDSDPATPAEILYLQLRKNISSGDNENSYDRVLGDLCLLGGGDRNIGNGWSIQSSVKKFSIHDVASGSVDFLYGEQNDFPAGDDVEGSPAGVRVHFHRNIEGQIIFDSAVLFSHILDGDVEGIINAPVDDEDLCPWEQLDVEIRAVNSSPTSSQDPDMHLFINGKFAGKWEDPPKVSDVHHIALRTLDDDIGDGDDDYSAFDYLRFLAMESEETFPLNEGDPTPVDFVHTATPFKQIFCNDFGFVDGSQYDFDWIDPTSDPVEFTFEVFGIAWRNASNGVEHPQGGTFGYWLDRSFNDQTPYRESLVGKHVYSETFENVNYIRLAEATKGSSWTILPVNQPHEFLDSHYTPTIVDSISSSVHENSEAFEAKFAGRHLFYNGSAFDDTSGPEPADEDAIAPEKEPLLGGATGSLSNYTNYGNGINGLILDIERPLVEPNASDFEFRFGNDDFPANWDTAPAPLSITVSAGANGSSRVTIIWDDGAIKNTWLQIKVLANRVGFCEDQVFYFGNAPAETGDSTAHALVNIVDLLRFRSEYGKTGVKIDNVADLNRDQSVNIFDLLTFRQFYRSPNPLELITPQEN